MSSPKPRAPAEPSSWASKKPRAEGVALAALRLVVAGVPAVCVVATCTLCHDVFSPLGGPCGSVVCAWCLREWLPAHTEVCCSSCGPSQRGMCPVRRTREQDWAADDARAARATKRA